MSTGLWVLVAVLAAAVVATFLLSPAMRRRRLRKRFGPAYERAVAKEGDRRSAERRLTEVAKRRESLDLRSLSERERQSFAARWNEIQAAFVDQPMSAAGRADELIKEVVRARGYPAEDFDTRADLLAIDDPRAAEDYREADALWKRNGKPGAPADTEELRAALVRYRSLFELLVGPGATPQDPGHTDRSRGADQAGEAGRDGRDGRMEESGAGSTMLHRPVRKRTDRAHSN